ncbi:MAG: NAD(P)/FAD-dependent oxidoreductase [Bradymonadaceae bacterium]|nr:NAD(P)/FAD-dependent oxidoreductase [Lujinxingiaceae bacterium]
MNAARVNPEPAHRPTVVIIGGGFGGINAAKALRRAPVDIVLVDRNNYHLFQPLLYQVATAGLSAEDIASPIRVILRRQKNAHVILGAVESIDPDTRRVYLDNCILDYDYLLLASGMETNYFGQNHWVPLAPGLKTLEDALECRRRILTAFEQAERTYDPDLIRKLLTFVVIGAGATGVEMAGAIREIALQVMAKDFRHIDPRMARVMLVDAGPRVLAGYDPRLSLKALRALEKMGIEVVLEAKVDDIFDGGIQVGDRRIEACTVVWAAGVRASPIAQSLKVPLDRFGRVIVEPDLSIPGHQEVFVIGDLAHFAHDLAEPLPGLAPVAIQQGQQAATNIGRLLAIEPTRGFRYRDRGKMATIGRAQAIAEIRGFRFSGYFAWLTWLLVHLLFLIGFRNRLMVLLDWAYAYIGQRRGARLIIEVEAQQPSQSAVVRKPYEPHRTSG